ncbi:MAG: transposase [Gammaproteobacteria bacterium]
MAMGKRRQMRQDSLFVAAQDLPKTPSHPFYKRLNEILVNAGFDAFVEKLCEGFYARKMGRPSLPPAIYFRILLVGYFEGIDSERGIAWRVTDSLSLKRFLGYSITDATPDHSTISRNRRLIDVETHDEVFVWVLRLLAREKLLDGKTGLIDATTLEANAAMRSIVRRDTDERYAEYMTRLAEESGIDTPTRQDLAKLDRTRKNKASNRDWKHPFDPDAEITKMKDGRTHMAHKSEHMVDAKTGAILAVTLQPASRGDTASMDETVQAADANLTRLMDDQEACNALNEQVLGEVVADKGYHSDKVLTRERGRDIRTYISEPDRGKRKWAGKSTERDAVYANRRRIRGQRGRRLLRSRGELVERSFAHCYDTGGMRRTHLKGHENIRKRLLIHVAGFNLSLLLRRDLGWGTARGLQSLWASIFGPLWRIFRPQNPSSVADAPGATPCAA